MGSRGHIIRLVAEDRPEESGVRPTVVEKVLSGATTSFHVTLKNGLRSELVECSIVRRIIVRIRSVNTVPGGVVSVHYSDR